MAEVHKVNPTIVGVGPEIAGTSGHATEYMMHFLDPANHKGYQGPSPLPSSHSQRPVALSNQRPRKASDSLRRFAELTEACFGG